MPDYKRYGVAGATMAVILLTGQVMQMTASNKREQIAAVQAMPLPVEISDITLTAAETLTAPEPEVSKSQGEPSPDDITEARNTMVTAALESNLLEQPGARPQTAPKQTESCKAIMTATPKAAALVDLDLEAPCMPHERVVIHHNGLMFSEVTDGAGMMRVTAPALNETAVFIASFANGEGAVATTNVEELKYFDRAVVQMHRGSGIQLHALEFGTDYGTKGHVWSGAPGSVADGTLGYGGFHMSLGDTALDDALIAEVYTYPSKLGKEAGSIVLSVDVEITEANCTQDIEAQSLQTNGGSAVKVQDLDLSMPDCDAVGDFILLKKMLNDMKVAFN